MNAARNMLRRSGVLIAVLVVLGGLPSEPARAQAPFTTVLGFATKTGFRLVFAWQATTPVAGVVEYGPEDTSSFNRRAMPQAVGPDSAQMAVADIPASDVKKTFQFRVRDQITGSVSQVSRVGTHNAWNDHNGSTYTVNLLVQLDSEALPDPVFIDQGLIDIANGVDVLAERIHDAMDGYARIGTVLVTDTNLDYATTIPFASGYSFLGTVCSGTTGVSVADTLIQTSIPFDSHTFLNGIDDKCTQIHLGRAGWLVVPWINHLDFGFTFAHELMHYAFGAHDLYSVFGVGGCRNQDLDVSIMHNTGGWEIDPASGQPRWFLTELDRNKARTPCDIEDDEYNWPTVRKKYTSLPEDPAVVHGTASQATGNPDGGALDIWVLNRRPGTSTLTKFNPPA